LGALCAQENEEGKERALYYLSRKLLGAKLHYSLIEKMCLALMFVVQKLRHYMQAHTIRVISKADSIKYILSRPVLSGCLAKGVVILEQYDLVYMPQKAVKGQALADFLTDHPIPDNWELNDDIPGEEVFFIDIIPLCEMYFDGTARQDAATAEEVLISPKKHILSYSFALMQLCFNNVAEYQALILGLQMALEMGIKDLDVYGGSQLVINQLLEEYEVMKKDLVSYHTHACQILERLDIVKLQHILRSANKMADVLENLVATLALGVKEDMAIPFCGKWVVTPLEVEATQEINAISVYEVQKEDWHQPLIDYLRHGRLPNDVRHKKKIQS